jgi:hypothetical protein
MRRATRHSEPEANSTGSQVSLCVTDPTPFIVYCSLLDQGACIQSYKIVAEIAAR